MKRIVSILLAVCILLSLSVGILAATVTPTADVTSVKAGESVKVTLTLDETLTKITAMGYRLYFDSDVFTLASSTSAKFWSVDLKNDTTKGSYYAVTFAVVSDDNDGTVKAGQIAELTFTAKSDLNEEQAASFELVFEKCKDENFANVSASAGSAVNVAVKPADTTPSTGYSIAIKAPSKANVGDDVTVSLQISGKDTYNAADIRISYPADKLTYKASSLSEYVKDNNGSLKVYPYGEDRSTDTAITLTFSAKAEGNATVTITSANIDEKSNADSSDAPEAKITTADATIAIGKKMHTVDLPDIFTADSTTVEDGASYTFSKTDKNEKHYEYKDVSATMDGAPTTVKDNGDGTYMIANVTGDLVISGTRTAKSYNVAVTGSGAGDATCESKAIYGTDYTFTVAEDAQYTYEVSVTADGNTVTATKSGSGYTISGADIEGDIVITVVKTAKPASTVKVSFEGTGSGDATGNATAEVGRDYKFTLDKKAGYSYTVSAKNSDNTDISVTNNGDGTYTIAGANIVSGKDITITITKTANRDIEVVEYLKLDGQSIFLVTVKGTVDKAKALTYNGEKMFWSEKYSGYAYLVISSKTLDEVTAEAKAATIVETSDTPTEILYTGDANMTGKVEINDAQFVWNVYNANYSDFTKCSMEKFLRADVNGDKTVNTLDSAAIINTVLG